MVNPTTNQNEHKREFAKTYKIIIIKRLRNEIKQLKRLQTTYAKFTAANMTQQDRAPEQNKRKKPIKADQTVDVEEDGRSAVVVF